MENLIKHENESFQIKSTFGIEVIPKGIQFLDKRHCIYLAGSTFVILDVEESKIVKNVPCSCKGEIKRFVLCKDKKIVVCNEELKSHINLIYQVYLSSENEKKEKIYSIENSSVISMVISSDSKYLMCQTGLPNWKLILFDFESLKSLKEINVINSDLKRVQTVSEISFFPNDDKRVILVGHFLIKTYTITNNSLRILNYIPCNYEIETHCWQNKNIIFFDKFGNSFLIILNSSKIKKLILKNNLASESTLIEKKNNNNNNSSSDRKDESDNLGLQTENDITSDFQSNYDLVDYGMTISKKRTIGSEYGFKNKKLKINRSITSTNKGFILNNLSNKVFYYEYERDNEYNFLYKIEIPFNVKDNFICDICYYHQDSDEFIICFTNSKKVYFFDLAFLNSQNKSAEFQIVFQNFHNDWITGIGMCLKKAIFLTCSLDGYLNVWNYETNSLELQKQFNEELLCVCLHPLGLFIVLGTKNNLKYMSMSLNTINTLHEFQVRACNECRFSNGGHLIACIHGSVIQIFSTLNYLELATIKARQVSKIKKLQFTKYDRYLIAGSMAGIVTLWDLRTFTPIHEILNKGISFMDITLHPEQEWVFTISTDQFIRQFGLNYANEQKILINKTVEPFLKTKIQDINPDEKLRCIECSRSGDTLVVGTTQGYLKFYDINQNLKLIKQHRAHFSFITCISFTFTENYLISCSLDGLVVFWNLNTQSSKIEQNEDILVNRTEYNQKLNEIKLGHEKLKEANSNVNFEFKLKQLKFNERIRGLTKKFNTEILILTEQIKQQKDFENTNFTEFDFKVKNIIEENMNRVEKERKIQLAKNRFEFEKIKNLECKIDDLKFEIQEKAEMVKIESLKNIKSIEKEKKDAFEIIMKRNKTELETLTQNFKNLKEYKENYLTEINNELCTIRTSSKKTLCELSKINKNLKIESTLLRRQIDSRVLYMEEYKTLFLSKETEIAELSKKITELEKVEDSLRQQILKNDKQASESDSRINELILIGLDLEKYDCVHKFTIEELNKQVDPIKKENLRLITEIDEIKKECQKNEQELVYLFNSKHSLKLKHLAYTKEIEKIKHDVKIKYEKCRLILLLLHFTGEKFLRKNDFQPQLMVWFEKTFLDRSKYCFLKIIESTKLSKAIKILYSKFSSQFYKEGYKTDDRSTYNTNNFIKSINRKRFYLERKITHQKKLYKKKNLYFTNRIKSITRKRVTNENDLLLEEKNVRYLEKSLKALKFAELLMKECKIDRIETLKSIIAENLSFDDISNLEEIKSKINGIKTSTDSFTSVSLSVNN